MPRSPDAHGHQGDPKTPGVRGFVRPGRKDCWTPSFVEPRRSWTSNVPQGLMTAVVARASDACGQHPGCSGPRAPQGFMDAEFTWALDASFLGTQASRAPDGIGHRQLQEDSWAQRLCGLHPLAGRTLDSYGRKGASRNRGRAGFVGPRSKDLRTLKLRGLQTLMDFQRAPGIRGR